MHAIGQVVWEQISVGVVDVLGFGVWGIRRSAIIGRRS